jgi:hypothetical protein
MSLISQEMSATFRMPNDAWAKIVIKLEGIDTEQDIENQIREANEAQDKVYGSLKNRLENQVREALTEATENIRVVA